MRKLVMTLALLGACASGPKEPPVKPAADAQTPAGELARQIEVEIAAGKFVELNLEVPASTIVAAVPIDPIEVAFEASASLAWDVHTHHGGEVQLLASGSDATGKVLHVPSQPGGISVLFENKSGAPVRAKLRIEGLPVGATGEWYPPTR